MRATSLLPYSILTQMTSSSSQPNQSVVDIVEPTPLLANSDDLNSGRRFLHQQSLLQAARFLRQVSSRRLLREPSMLVREAAAEQLEERHSDWAYSKPVVVLDVIWNFMFVVVAAMVLILSRLESPETPLRIWIVGYATQCIVHMVCVCVEFRRRQKRFSGLNSGEGGVGGSGISRHLSQYVRLADHLNEEGTGSVFNHVECANTMFSFIWWVVGFYWVSIGGQALARASPQLYWLCITFLGFDVFFVVFCVALACIIGIAVCCCLPCIIALLYAVADQDGGGASKEDIEQLPKFKFQRVCNGKVAVDSHGPHGGVMTECGTDSPNEHLLSPEDTEYCICLSCYDDGAELRQLPCAHRFHCSCIDTWLFINATCPLCKYNEQGEVLAGHSKYEIVVRMFERDQGEA